MPPAAKGLPAAQEVHQQQFGRYCRRPKNTARQVAIAEKEAAATVATAPLVSLGSVTVNQLESNAAVSFPPTLFTARSIC